VTLEVVKGSRRSVYSLPRGEGTSAREVQERGSSLSAVHWLATKRRHLQFFKSFPGEESHFSQLEVLKSVQNVFPSVIISPG